MKKFSGIWASFEYLDQMTHVIEAAREKGYDLTTLSPCPRHEIDHALGEPQSRLPFITLFFSALGCLTGYSFTAWTAVDWVLPVGGKPILAIPAFTVIGFELTILFGAMFSMMGMVGLIIVDTLRHPIPKSAKDYLRFQRDRFGVVVRCDSATAKEVEELFKSHGAEEVHLEA